MTPSLSKIKHQKKSYAVSKRSPPSRVNAKETGAEKIFSLPVLREKNEEEQHERRGGVEFLKVTRGTKVWGEKGRCPARSESKNRGKETGQHVSRNSGAKELEERKIASHRNY